jgi:hypothetical protein
MKEHALLKLFLLIDIVKLKGHINGLFFIASVSIIFPIYYKNSNAKESFLPKLI